MPSKYAFPIMAKIERSQRKIGRLIEKIKAVAFEEFEYLVPEVDKIISESNTDFEYIGCIFTALIGVAVSTDNDESVVDKLYELLQYAISIDMSQAIVLAFEYNYFVGGLEEEDMITLLK